MPDHPTYTHAPDLDPGATRTVHAATASGGSPLPGGDPPPPPAERYLLGDEIARGGMGIVYRATDAAFGREVAVKVLQDRYGPASGAARRFADEARITGQLQHPAIPPVHDFGTLPDGRPFLAMKLVRGRTLEVLLAERADPSADRGRFVAAFEQVCQAVAYAHDHQVIHRDLKPANVMVGSYGEVQVMDWGLAKVLGERPGASGPSDHETAAGTAIHSLRDSDGSFTQAGSVLGTPAFMPPEQALGAVNKIDARSDVFGLGGILAVILTGSPPFAAGSAETIRIEAAQGKVDDCLARLDGCGADPGLVALCKRCLAPEKAERPADAGVVAQAVGDLRAAADERARRAEVDRAAAEAEAREQRKRRRVQLALAAAVGLMVVGGGAVAWWQDNQATDRRAKQERDEQQRDQAERERDARNAQAIESLLAQVEDAVQADDAERAALPLAQIDKRLGEGGAESLRDRIARCRADLAMIRALAKADEDFWTRADISWYHPRLTAGWVEAFRAYGFDYETTPTQDAARLVNGSAIRERLLGALEMWHSRRYSSPTTDRERSLRAAEERAAVRKLLNAADPDPYRMEVREAIHTADKTLVRELVNDPQALRQPVRFAVVFAQNRYVPLAGKERILAPAVEKSPGNLSLLLALAKIYDATTEGRKESAPQQLRWSQAAVAVRPGNKVAWRQLARAHWDQGNMDDALACVKTALRLEPDDLSTLCLLSGVWTRKADPERGVEYAERALRLAPDYAPAHDCLGAARERMNDVDGAIRSYQKAVELDPSSAWYLNNLGAAHLRKGEYDQAIDCFREARIIDSSFQKALVNLERASRAKSGDRERDTAPPPRPVVR